MESPFADASRRAAERLDSIEEPSLEYLQASEDAQNRTNSDINRMYSAFVVLVGDHQMASGSDTDRLVVELLEECHFAVDGVVKVPSREPNIRQALETAVVGGADLVITIGGTGVGPRDHAPEATEGVLDKHLPGIAQALRASGLACGAVDACISRGIVGVSGSTIVVNLAASRAAIRDGMATLLPLVGPVIKQLRRWSIDT